MNKCENITNIRFLKEEKALCEHVVYTKEQIMSALETAMLSSEKNRISKSSNNEETIYRFKIDDMLVNVHISKRFENYSKSYIEKLEEWKRNDRNKRLKTLKLMTITAAISAGVTAIAYEPVKEVIKTFTEEANDLLTDEVGDLEKELLIHSGYGYTPDGRSISPFLDHGCIFNNGKDLYIEERISLYCKENGLEYMEAIALEKWSHLMNDSKEFADTIDLKVIEKEYKEIQKIKN